MLKVLEGYAISQRWACILIGVDPKTVRRECPPDHGAIRIAMREIAGQRRRFGYRRIGVILERQGMNMNHKKLYRLYREERLSVRRCSSPKTGARRSIEFVSELRASAATRSGPRANSEFWQSMMIACLEDLCRWMTPSSGFAELRSELGRRAN